MDPLVTTTKTTKNKKFKKIPPEGGWGWMVAVAVFVSISLQIGPLSSFGIIFADFLESINASTTSVTTLHAFYKSSTAIIGLFANYLHKKFSCRQIALAGAIIFVIGNFATIFAASMEVLYFTYGILPGIGFGLFLPAILTSFNTYFVRKRNVAMLTTKPFVGLTFMLFPLISYTVLDQYGFRGALAILAAISSHIILAAITLQPVENHLIIVEVTEEENIEQTKPLLSVDNANELKLNQGDIINSSHLNISIKKEETTGEITSIIDDSTYKKRCIQSVIDFFDFKLLTQFSYVNIVVGICFAEFSVMAFLTLQPLYLLSNGWTKQEVSVCISIMGASDIVSKISLAIFSRYYPIKSRYIFLAGAFFTAITRIWFLLISNHTAIIVVSALLGVFKCWILAVFVLVISEHVSIEQFPGAYGLYMFAQGLAQLILGPIVGYVKDVTGSYTICLHVLSAILMVCVVPWFAEIILTRTKSRNKH